MTMTESKFLTEAQAKKELSRWTLTAHGLYRHADGRKVRRVNDGHGFYSYYRYAADGTCLTPAAESRLLADW